jgi:hypothetical protein
MLRFSCSPLFSEDPASISVAGETTIGVFVVAGFGSTDPVEDISRICLMYDVDWQVNPDGEKSRSEHDINFPRLVARVLDQHDT